MKYPQRHRWILAVLTGLALAHPVVPVKAQITPADSQTQVTSQDGQFLIQGGIISSQGDNLFYGFEQFSLSSGESATFFAPAQIQNVFGQVVGGQAAYVNGRLAISGAPANLYLISPAGLLFGPDAQLNLPGQFTATTASRLGFADGWLTADLDPTHLNGAPQQFAFESPSTSLINLGDLSVGEGQSITLLGGTVINRGSLTAPAGAVTVAAIEQGVVQISPAGQVLSLAGDISDADWQLAVADLPAWLTGTDIDHALNLIQDASGQTLITGSELSFGPAPGTVVIAGRIDASGSIGGTVQVLGERLAVINASLQANGISGGGSIHIGGDLQGGGTLPTADVTLVNRNTVLSADASQQGDGGRIIVWADELTHFTGSALAQGGVTGGNGGFIEISGKEQLQFDGEISLNAPWGEPGTLLLDPRNIVIKDGTGGGTNDALLPSVLTNTTLNNPFIIFESVLEGLPDANIILQAADNITIEPLGELRLTTSTNGRITFNADTDNDGIGSFSMVATDRINTGGRDLIITGANISTGELITGVSTLFSNAYAAGDITLTARTGSVTTGDIYARSQVGISNAGTGGQVNITAAQNIVTGNISTNSFAGIINASSGGNITLTAIDGNITTNNINAFSLSFFDDAAGGGNIFLSAQNGQINSRDLNTFARALGNENATNAGSVTLLAAGAINIDLINAEGEIKGGIVDILTNQQFTATETFFSFNGELNSISSIGRNGEGQFRLQAGNSPFGVGTLLPNVSGTAGGIVSGRLSNPDVVAPGQSLTEDVSQGSIQIILSTPLPNTGTITASATTSQSPSSESFDVSALMVGGNSSINTFEQLTAIEKDFSQQFVSQLGLADDYNVPLAFSLEEIQRVLATAEDQLDIHSALIYLYFAEDQLEALIVTSEGQPYHRSTGFSHSEVLQLGQNFRKAVTNPTLLPADYLPPAQALHQALIAPIETELQRQDIDNLALVLDSGLRSLPLAALHDGQQFLIERYAIGILPTFNLTNFDWAKTLHQQRVEPTVLAMGIAEFTDQSPLPAVPAELNVITPKADDQAYLNSASTWEQLRTSMSENNFGIVHLATHALFEPGDTNQAYVQLWDQNIQFNQLKSLDFQTADVSLLVLSACQTALGDEAAEFGFAGLAVSTGAQSALASLWAVSDDGALGFMSQFYQNLRSRPVRGEAVQQAQIALLRGQVRLDQGSLYGPDGEVIATVPELVGSGRWDYTHPVYWSAFTLIGNPW